MPQPASLKNGLNALLTPEESVLILIDHQPFQFANLHSHEPMMIVNNVIGLEMKLRQYELGQRFCDTVVARRGPDVLGKLWVAPSHLPTLAELRQPDLWLTRVA